MRVTQLAGVETAPSLLRVKPELSRRGKWGLAGKLGREWKGMRS